MKTITIDPITRLEGHGKISIFLDDQGEVENAILQIPELRGFERFCEGRRAELLPILTQRICGVCPVPHHFASTKALDMAFHADPPLAAKKLRELMMSGYYVYDHILHFYFLGGPDFVVGPDAPAAQRNVLGVINKVGVEIGKEVIKHRAYGQRITQIIGGRATHPVCGLPGGISKIMKEEERQEIERMAKSSVDFAQFTLKVFSDVVLKNPKYVDLIKSEAYRLNTYYMGTVDEKNRVNFYDGKVRVVDPAGREYTKFAAEDYLKTISEHVEDWTYVKFTYLKNLGWRGLTEGKDTSLYRVGPLGRLNAADGMATPLAQEEYERMYKTLGERPSHSTLAYHWARLVELLYAAERTLELSQDPDIMSKEMRTPVGEPGEGVGITEACRGTLIHHYQLDNEGLSKKVNLVVATTNNAGSICMSIKKAAQGLIHKGVVNDGLLNMVEMAFRAYDPCFSCATHFAYGELPLQIVVYDRDMKVLKEVSR